MFFDMFSALCKKNKVSMSAVARVCGLSNSTTTKWKKGAIPESATLQKIAEYFGVSVDYLLAATPESYLLWTEYKLEEAEKAFAKEVDADKRDEIGAEIDGLRDSLEDQRMAIAMTPKQTTPSDGAEAELDELLALRQELRERPELKMLLNAGKKATPATARRFAQFLEEAISGEKDTD